MNLRRISSLTAALTFICTIFTSVVLFIGPQGRVAYWADWRLWGLTKEQWSDLHITLGTLFLLALLLHMYYNWTPLLSYLKDKVRNLRVFTPSFAAALLLCLGTLMGTLAGLPPFSSLLTLADWFKGDAALIYGEPPYGHAELSSLRTFAKKVDLELGPALARLAAAGVKFGSPEETMQQIASANRMSPQKVYQTMLPSGGGKPKDLPASPPAGTGNRTLTDLCAEFGLNLQDTLRSLEARGIKAEAGKTLKEIATENNIGPLDLFEILRAVTAGG